MISLPVQEGSAMMSQPYTVFSQGDKVCDHCHMKNHTRETCWDLHGRPARGRGRDGGRGRGQGSSRGPGRGGGYQKAHVADSISTLGSGTDDMVTQLVTQLAARILSTTSASSASPNSALSRADEVTRCLLFAMHVPRYLWREAVQTATYLIHKIPLRAVDFSTPLEMLTGTTSFKVPPKKFGCVCFVHNTSPGISKLDAKAHKCVFVGYSSGKKRYRCYDPVKKRMLESLDVTFRETEPYFTLSDAQSNASSITFLDLLEVVVTHPSD